MARRTTKRTATTRPATPQGGVTAGGAGPAQRQGRRPPPPNESRRDRFLRIGQRRMNNVIRQIQLLGNLSSSAYDCQQSDIDLMREVIARELEAALGRFTPRQRQGGSPTFTFDGRHTHH